MKKNLACISALIASASSLYAIPSLADTTQRLPEPPPLNAYMATGQKATLQERAQQSTPWLKNVYVSAKMGYAGVRVHNIQNSNSVTPGIGATIPTATQTSQSASDFTWAAALGYAVPLKFPSRIEIEYQHYNQFGYNPQPAIDNPVFPQNLSSNVNLQTLMGNLYYDMDLGYPIIPYLGGGAGAAFTKTEGTATFAGDSLSQTNSNTNLAWDVQAGLRIKITPNAYLSAGYEFVSFGGGLQWQLLYGNQLKSSSPYSNNIVGAFTWQFTG